MGGRQTLEPCPWDDAHQILGFYQETKARGNELGLFQTRHLDFVYKMAILRLTNVEVFVGDRSQP